MAPNSNRNLKIIYPEETDSIISTLLEKYGLKESEEKFLEKLKQGKSPSGQILAKVIKKTAENEISMEDFPSVLQERLNISKEKAEKLAEDIKKEILDLIRKVPIEKEEEKIPPPLEKEKEITLSNKGPAAKKPEIKSKIPLEKPRKRDIYREPIE